MVPMEEALLAILIALCLAKGNCTDTEFQCNSGECIPMKERCDNFPQCKDQSDEAYCHTGSCAESQHLCDDGVTCITPEKWCDGTADCPDSSDEHPSCGGITTTTSSKSSSPVSPVTNTCTKGLSTTANTGTPTPTTSSSPVPPVTSTGTRSLHSSTTACNTAYIAIAFASASFVCIIAVVVIVVYKCKNR